MPITPTWHFSPGLLGHIEFLIAPRGPVVVDAIHGSVSPPISHSRAARDRAPLSTRLPLTTLRSTEHDYSDVSSCLTLILTPS